MTENLTPYRPLNLMKDDKLTKASFDDFIGVWDNFIPKPWCDRIIKFGDAMLDQKLTDKIDPIINDVMPITSDQSNEIVYMDGESMYNGKHNREDESFLLNYTDSGWTTQCNQFLKSCVTHYIDHYSVLQKMGFLSSDSKFQRTKPGGGYHIWHHENGSYFFHQREIVWMIYLNDIEEGGETEFLYQKRRIKPTQGTVVIWPANFTHTHRGGLLCGDKDKYILTGWYTKSGEK